MSQVKCRDNTWNKDGDKVVCHLCPWECSLKDGQSGICRIRSHRDGNLVLDNYGMTVVAALDDISKRPIRMYECDNSKSLSIGLTGCNNRCPFCQNYMISQVSHYDKSVFRYPEEIVENAVEKKVGFISFSFNEPLVGYEYFLDVANLAKKNGIKICLKTAGYINKEFYDECFSCVDVMNVDIKPVESMFLEQCGISHPDVVYEFISAGKKKGIHVEISHIIMEGLNDCKEKVSTIVLLKFCEIMKMIGEKTPIHLLRHYPEWKSTYPTTSDKSLQEAFLFCKNEGLENVFYQDVK